MPKTRLTPYAHAIAASRWPYALTSLLLPGLALAGPTGGSVTGGQAAITTPNAATTVVNQASNAAIIQWQSFNVASQEYVIFNQPSASAAVLNRVVGGDASTILGHLQSNGRVFLVNPRGVLFGQGAQVNVGSLVASTLDVADQDFLNNKFAFKAPTGMAGSVVNQGNIVAGNAGFVVLAGDYVKNTGVITAKLGDIALASGSAATLDMNGDGLINVAVDRAALSARAGVENVGQIVARGGSVVMTARVARELMHAAVNNSGMVSAQGIAEKGGDIFLTATGGDIADSGTLDASGLNNYDAGNILIHSDRNVDLTPTANLDFTGRNGGNARLIADRSLNIAKGSVIDGRASNPLKGRGGFAEVSGHGHLNLDSVPTLGKGGSLLIDPAAIYIYNATPTPAEADCQVVSCISVATVDTSLNSQPTFLVADSSITVAHDADINSQSTFELLLGIGNTTNNFTRANAGAGSGTIEFLGLPAGDNNNIYRVNIGGDLQVHAGLDHGVVTLGNISAGGLHVAAVDNIRAGDIVVTGGGLTLQSRPATDTVAEASLVSDSGTVIINSAKLTATANSYSYSDYGGAAHNISRGDALLSLHGASVEVGDTGGRTGGDITIFANGKGSVDIAAHAGGHIDVVGTTRVQISNTATDDAVLGNFHSSLRSGLANVSMRTGLPTAGTDSGRVTTGRIEAHGPNSNIDIESGMISMGYINAEAYTGDNPTQSYNATQGQSTLADSNFAVNTVFLMGRSGDSVTPSVAVRGTTTLTGPAVEFSVQAAGDVSFGDSVFLDGRGFHINGDAHQFTSAFNPDLPQSFNNGLMGTLLDTGSTFWGPARFNISGINQQQGGNNQSSAGKVTFNSNTYIGGATSTVSVPSVASGRPVQVLGVGEAAVSIQANGLSVTSTVIDRGGLTSPVVSAGDVNVDASTTAGTVNGTRKTTETVNGASYHVTHVISDGLGQGGAAKFGEGHFDYKSNGTGDVDMGALQVSGFSANGSFNGGGNIHLHGGANIAGAASGGSAIYNDVSTYAGANQPLNNMTFATTIQGDVNAFGVGFQTAPASFTSDADVTVRGHGFTVAFLRAGTINAQSVDAENLDGHFKTDDPAAIGAGPVIDATPGAGMRVQATGTTLASTHRIYAHDDNGGDISFGVQAIAQGGVEAETSGAIVNKVPGFVLDFSHPLSGGHGGGSIQPDLVLPVNNITADQFSFKFGKTSNLANSTLNAVGSLGAFPSSGFIRINDDGTSPVPVAQRVALDVGSHSIWTAGELTMENVGISGGMLDIFSNGATIGTQEYAGQVSLDYSTLNLDSLTITADHSNITITDGGGTLPANPALITATTLALKATNGSLNLVDSKLTYTNGALEGDTVKVQNTQLVGVSNTQQSGADKLTITGHGAVDAFGVKIAVDINGGSMITGTAADITGNHGLVSLNSASTNVSGNLNVTASDGSIDIFNNSMLGFHTSTLTAISGQTAASGQIFIGTNVASASRTAAVLNFSNGSLTVDADVVKIDHATLNGDGGSFTGSAHQFFDIGHSKLRADTADITGHGDSQGDGITHEFIADDFVLTTSFMVHADKAIDIFDDTSTYGGPSSISAPTMLLHSGSFVSINNTSLSGAGLTVTTGVDTAAGYGGGLPSFSTGGSQLQFNKNIAIDAGGSAILNGGSILSLAGEGAPVTDGNVVIHATGPVALSGNINVGGSHSTKITSGASQGSAKTISPPSTLLLNGTVGRSSGYVLLLGRDGVVQNGNLTINANALDVGGKFISLGNSIINVGGGAAVQGHDDGLLQLITNSDSGLLPPTAAPNASFVALEDVVLGTVNFNGGHYMFVQAGASTSPCGACKTTPTGPSFGVGAINFSNSLLLNFTPADSTVNTALSAPLATKLPSGVTLALGSSNYLGDITVATQNSPVSTQNVVNFIFATKGAVIGSEFLHTNGRVLVLSGITATQGDANQAVNNVNNLGNPANQGNNNGAGAGAGGGDGSGAVQNSFIEYNSQSGDGTFECT